MAYGKTTQAFIDMDDTTKYVFHNYLPLLTENEKLAWKSLSAAAKGEASQSEQYAHFLSTRFRSDRAQVVSLLKKGPHEFFVGVRDRVLKEHKDNVILNHCPKCGALARTPRARICPKCSFNWRETSSK
jgi:hypothetical protein